jgi:glycosyltransferase involved in cell wall biosynthesis
MIGGPVMGLHIGFISTRFAGTDGVSLEAGKWAEVLASQGHHCYWFAGESDQPSNISCVVPEAHFKHRQVAWINDQVFGHGGRTRQVSDAIHRLRESLKRHLYRFIAGFRLDLLIAENALTIPMNIPLGLALTELIAETSLPIIAHHHDFFWERTRYTVNGVGDCLRAAFPPQLPRVQHVVLNTNACETLAHRSGTASLVVPNVLDFAHPPQSSIDRNAFRHAVGLAPDDIVILQPTRIIRRKGIEHAIELVKALKDPRCKLLLSHDAGDEGYDYPKWLETYAADRGVKLHTLPNPLHLPGLRAARCHPLQALWEIYDQADLVTYPSIEEGFGNGFLEAVYLKKPILVNRYATFIRDLEPLGFDVAVMDGYLTRATIDRVNHLLHTPARRKAMGRHNYAVATQHFSYDVLRRHFRTLLAPILTKHRRPQSKIVPLPATGSPPMAPSAMAKPRYRHKPRATSGQT